jgi:hypothetical protein
MESAALIDRMCAAARAENRAAGARLVAVGEFDLLWLRHYGSREMCVSDTQMGAAAEVSAALQVSRMLAISYLHHARAMRNRLPRVGAMLCSGDISYAMFRTIVSRTDLITDPQVMAAVDATLAVKGRRWPSLTLGKLAGYVDKVVARRDRDAVRQRREWQAEREFSIADGTDGLTEISGRLLTPDAHAVDARLDALAATVCGADPRTARQRRADALGALAAGAQRLGCRCGRPDCVAGSAVPRPVVLYVIAEQATVEGSGQAPGSMIGSDALIPAELITELADSARQLSLSLPVDASPEAGYVPSAALADFVGCRDLTCRFPGCDAPASEGDLDHTIPYADGGPTHASKVRFFCRLATSLTKRPGRSLEIAMVSFATCEVTRMCSTPTSGMLGGGDCRHA